MAKTFTKIRKWAENKGFKVEDVWAYGNKPAIQVTVNDDLHFKIEMRDSTIYHSVRGIKGDRAGMYMSSHRKPKDGRYFRAYGFYQESQTYAIEGMENEIREMEARS